MLNKKICCFAGHKDVRGELIKVKIKETASSLIINDDVRTFWVGNYGSFDRCAAEAINELKAVYHDIVLELVIPYVTNQINCRREHYYSFYDSIVTADIPFSTPPRFRILKSNQYMIDKSSFLICFVSHSWGGAAKTLKYAERKKHIKVFNIALQEA